MGPAVMRDLPNTFQLELLDYYNLTYPTIPIVARAAETAGNNDIFICTRLKDRVTQTDVIECESSSS